MTQLYSTGTVGINTAGNESNVVMVAVEELVDFSCVEVIVTKVQEECENRKEREQTSFHLLQQKHPVE